MSRIEESRGKRHIEDEMNQTAEDKRETSQTRTGLVTSFVRHFSICSDIVKANGSKGSHLIEP